MNWLLQTMWRLNLRLKHFKAPALKVFIFFAVAERSYGSNKILHQVNQIERWKWTGNNLVCSWVGVMICVLRSLIVMLGREAANLYLFVKRNLEMKSNSNLISMDKRIQLGSQHRVTTSMKLPDEVVLLPQTCHVINAQTVKRWHLFSHHGMVGNSRVWQFSEKRVTAMRIMACLSFVGSSLLNSFSSKQKVSES